MSVSLCLESRSFIVRLKISSFCPSTLFFKSYLVTLDPLHFHTTFRIIFFVFYKTTKWNFDWDFIKSVDIFGENCYLNNVEVFFFLMHEHGTDISFRALKFFLSNDSLCKSSDLVHILLNLFQKFYILSVLLQLVFL